MLKTILSSFLTTIFVICFMSVFAQDGNTRYIGMESGINVIFTELPEYDFIRGDMDDYGGGVHANELTGYCSSWYAGVKTESRSKNKHFGFTSGIHFTRLSSNLTGSSYYSSNADIFYLLLREHGTTTEYLKVKEVTESSNYIGIPLEIRYIPYHEDMFGFYLKAGSSFNYRLSSTHDVEFYNDEMSKYKNDVVAKFEEPVNLFSNLYFGAGLIIGNEDKPHVGIEGVAPTFVFSRRVSGIVDPIAGIGFQVHVYVPLNQ